MIDDHSTSRRLTALQNRLDDLAREVERLNSQSSAPAAPRDLFIGRTVANGETYPTSGNTFWVELSRGDFSATAGDSDLTEYRTGTKVLARTWPEQYLPEGQPVVVMRMRGRRGPGEWWIETHAASIATYWAYLIGGGNDELSSGPTLNPALGWSAELLDVSATGGTVGPPASDPLTRGSAGVVESGRLSITVPGLYSVEAFAHVTLRWQSASIDGYFPQYDQLALTLLDEGSEIGQGFARVDSGRADGRATVRLSTLAIASGDPLELWISGGGAWYAGNLHVWRWQLLATRIADGWE